MLSSISSNSLKHISSKYSDSYQNKQAFSSVPANSLVHICSNDSYQGKKVLFSVSSNSLVYSSTEISCAHQDTQVFSRVSSNSLKRISSQFSDSHQDKQVFSGVASNSFLHFSSKDSYQDNQKLSSEYSNSLGCNSSKYLDSHQDKQVFFCATVNSAKYNSVKHLDSYQEGFSNFNCFIDIENPYYENDCTPPDSDDDDYILGINVDPYIQEYRTPPEMEDSKYDDNFYGEENESPLVNEWRFHSKYVDRNETNDPLLDGDWWINVNYEESDSLPADDWNFQYDANRNNEENNSSPRDDWDFNSNHADDCNYKDLSPGDNRALNSNYDPHNEENDSLPDNGYIFSFKYKANPNYEKSYSFSEIDRGFDSNHDADPNYEENDSSLGEDWDSNSNYDDFNEEYGTASDVDEWFNSKYNVGPYEKEYDSPPEEDFEFISNREVNSYCKGNKSLDLKNGHAFLLQFYESLVDELMEKLSIGYLDIRASLQYMISNHRRVIKGQLPSENDYCNISYCLGYLHRYAACHSVLISDSVSTILNSSSSNVLNTKLSREQLNIMFMGGGPGNDFVGFLTALHNYRDYPLNLDVTVVDKMSGWEDVFNETVQKLKKSRYGKVYQIFDDVAITTSFFSADLKNGDEWNTDMQNKLQKADIIFLVKVLSHIPNHEKLGVLENIILYMKPGALMIYADSPYPNREFAAVTRQLRPVYKSRKKSFAMKAKTFKF